MPAFAFIGLILTWVGPAGAGTLQAVKSAGELRCGVVTEEYDYSKDQTHGNMSAFGTDICKAVTAAVLGTGGKLVLSSFPDEKHGLNAVKSGNIALLAGATPLVTLGAIYDVSFGRPFFLDGQGFIVVAAKGINSIDSLAGKEVCFLDNTEAATTLAAVLHARHINYLPFPFQEQGEMDAALIAGRCAAMTGDVSQLANSRVNMHARVSAFVILPELISLEPLAPAFRNDDPQWAAIVDWTLYATIQAEASGITRANVDATSESDDLVINRWLTKAGGLSRALGLSDDWAVQVIKAVGNYGEMFAKRAGKQSPLQLDRGMNALWTKGGLLYPLPGR